MADEKLENQGEDDDFTFDIGKKPEGEESGETKGKEEKSTEGKEEKETTEKKEKSTEEKEEKSTEGKEEKSTKGKEEKPTEGKEEKNTEDKEEKFIDIFAGEEKVDEKKSTEGKASYKPIASDLGIELENDTPEEFKTKVSKKIEDAKQEFKLDDYPEEAKAVVRHLKENGGKIEDFLNNKDIVSLQGVKNLDPEQKVLFVRTNELIHAGIEEEKAHEQAAAEIEEYSSKELKDKSAAIDVDADKLISVEVKKITGDRSAFVERERTKVVEKTKAEIIQLKTYVTKQTEFLGIELSDKAKQSILKDIETGAFDDIANKSPESSKFTAYMMVKFGKNILETLNKKGSEQNRIGYNAATDKSFNALHKTKEAAQQKQAGHQKSKSGETGKFDGFVGALGEDE